RSGMAWLGWAARILDELDDWCRGAIPSDDAPADALEVLAELRAELAGGYRLAERVLALADTGQPGAVEASMTKVWATELLQRIARTALDLVGAEGVVWAPLFSDDPPDVPLRGRVAWELIERIHPT